jgi:hypothetical protein
MSDSLFSPPQTPSAAHGALKLAAQAAVLARLEIRRALGADTRAWTPEALAEAGRLFNAAAHLADSLHDLLPH